MALKYRKYGVKLKFTDKKEAHTSIDQWEERIVNDLNTRFEIDSQKNQILQEQMTSRDYQLRKCGDFLSRIIQGMFFNEKNDKVNH